MYSTGKVACYVGRLCAGIYLYIKYAILKFFLPHLWRKIHSHSSTCTVCNGKYMYSSFKHLKEPIGMAEKVQTPTRESKYAHVKLHVKLCLPKQFLKFLLTS